MSVIVLGLTYTISKVYRNEWAEQFITFIHNILNVLIKKPLVHHMLCHFYILKARWYSLHNREHKLDLQWFREKNVAPWDQYSLIKHHVNSLKILKWSKEDMSISSTIIGISLPKKYWNITMYVQKKQSNDTIQKKKQQPKITFSKHIHPSQSH